MSKHYETIISFSYDADSPEDAAQQFLDNINMKHSLWYVDVKDVETGEQFTVDSEDWSVTETGTKNEK